MALTEFEEDLLRHKAYHAIMTASQLRPFNQKAMSREEVKHLFGEGVALAWDDLHAARKSYSRAVERMIQERKEKNDEIPK